MNVNGAPIDEQLKKLLEQNLEYSKQIYLLSRKIKGYIVLGRVMSFISLILIVAPLIAGFIYLPNLLKGFMGSIIPAGLSNESTGNNLQNALQGSNLNTSDILKSIQEQGGVVNSYKKVLDLYNNQ